MMLWSFIIQKVDQNFDWYFLSPKVGVFLPCLTDECPIYFFFGTEVAEVNLLKMTLTPTCSPSLFVVQVRVFREALSCPPSKKVCRSILPRGRGKELKTQPLLAEPCGGVDMPALGQPAGTIHLP